MSTRDCVCFQDFCAEIDVLQDEVARLRESLQTISKANSLAFALEIACAALAEKEEK
jgi:regulator of sigma D